MRLMRLTIINIRRILKNPSIFLMTFLLPMIVLFGIVGPSSKENSLGKIGILLVISGAIGNLIDRVRLGFVVDYLDFHIIWSYVFNLADCFVVVGTILLCLYIITSEEKKDR